MQMSQSLWLNLRRFHHVAWKQKLAGIFWHHLYLSGTLWKIAQKEDSPDIEMRLLTQDRLLPSENLTLFIRYECWLDVLWDLFQIYEPRIYFRIRTKTITTNLLILRVGVYNWGRNRSKSLKIHLMHPSFPFTWLLILLTYEGRRSRQENPGSKTETVLSPIWLLAHSLPYSCWL